MKKNNKTIQIIEYERLYSDDKNIDKKTFESLEDFILENDTPFLILKSYQKRKYIQAQNYVGVIQTKSGITIEILPKITNLKENTEESRKILIKMIKTLKKPPFKDIDKADLKNSKMPLFEIFIKMFLDELSVLLKLGIKSNYLQKQDNLKFLKGKLLINQQIKKNYIHKERFFTEFDEFSIDRVENRLIKTALMFLLKKSNSNNNKKLIKRYLMVFDSVSVSYSIKNDFNKLKITRDMLHYETIISWAEIFLLNESFSIYKGNNIAFALLFDMNILFESYVGNFLRKECFKYNPEYIVKLQDRKHYLAYINNKPTFQLKPDIVIEIPKQEVQVVSSPLGRGLEPVFEGVGNYLNSPIFFNDAFRNINIKFFKNIFCLF
jgi:5-methylcytosine-specific restriction enzyme subunit McrC